MKEGDECALRGTIVGIHDRDEYVRLRFQPNYVGILLTRNIEIKNRAGVIDNLALFKVKEPQKSVWGTGSKEQARKASP
jgi:hypothetical protein